MTAVETSIIDFVKWGEEYLINGQYITYTLTTSPTYTFTVLYDTILRTDFDVAEAYINQYYYRKNDGSTSGFSQSHYGSFVILGADEVDDMYDQNGWVFNSWGRTRSAVTGGGCQGNQFRHH